MRERTPSEPPSASIGRAQPRFRSLGAEAVGLVVLALAAAAVSNAVAGSERRLEWFHAGPAAAAPVRTVAAGPGGSAALSASSAGAPATSAASATAVSSASSAKPWTEISSEEAETLFRSGVLFLDARRSSEYRLGHISGARSVPVWEAGLDDKVKALFEERTDQAAPIVVYCNGGECEDSHELAQKLYLAGFDAVRVYRDGFPDWSRRKLPSTKGDRP